MKKIIIAMIVFLVACSGQSNTDNSNLDDIVENPTVIPTQTIEIEYSDGEFLEIPEGTSFRFLNYNINWDSIFPDDDIQNMSYREINRQEEFSRLVTAIQPNIICLEEINPRRDPQQVADILIDITGDTNWKAVNERDNVIATTYEFIEGYSFEIGAYPPELPQAIAMVDLPDDLFGESDVFVVCSHFKSAGNSSDIKLRQRQADIIINRIGDAKTPGGVIDIPLNTPFILAGDYNIYDTDPAYHLTTLLTGDIVDEERYGGDVTPDWDETELTDAYPSVNEQGLNFDTWRDDGSPYTPGALDRIIYSDSVLAIINSFILDTTLLTDIAFDTYGLDFADVLFASELGNYDHLPMVVDFQIIDID